MRERLPATPAPPFRTEPKFDEPFVVRCPGCRHVTSERRSTRRSSGSCSVGNSVPRPRAASRCLPLLTFPAGLMPPAADPEQREVRAVRASVGDRAYDVTRLSPLLGAAPHASTLLPGSLNRFEAAH